MSEYRTGHKVGRTIYCDDKLIGVMDTPELAKKFVDAVNAQRPLDELSQIEVHDQIDKIIAAGPQFVSVIDSTPPAATDRECVRAVIERLLSHTPPATNDAGELAAFCEGRDARCASIIAAHRQNHTRQAVQENEAKWRAALSKADEALSEAREMLGVFEDNGGHDGLQGRGYLLTIDHMDESRKANRALLAQTGER